MVAKFVLWIEALGQWLQPPEFRIDPIRFPAAAPTPAPLARLQELEDQLEVTNQKLETQDRTCSSIIVELANGLWQTMAIILDSETRRPKPGMEKVLIILQNRIADLRMRHIELVDLTGKAYEPNSGLSAMFVERPELKIPTVLYTEEPKVVWNGQVIQGGKAIVGEPTGI